MGARGFAEPVLGSQPEWSGTVVTPCESLPLIGVDDFIEPGPEFAVPVDGGGLAIEALHDVCGC